MAFTDSLPTQVQCFANKTQASSIIAVCTSSVGLMQQAVDFALVQCLNHALKRPFTPEEKMARTIEITSENSDLQMTRP